MIVMTETELLTLEEAGKRVGVSKYTIRAWIARGTLEGILLGGRWRVRPEALERFVMRNTKPENTEK